MSDLISRKAAIRWIKAECNPYGKPTLDYKTSCKIMEHLDRIPSTEPERLTDDDFETIRIHLNAYKEKLCNQRRWEEAEEYQRIIDRFMAFASAEPEVIRCKDCKYWYKDADSGMSCEYTEMSQPEDGFCNWAERRGEQE